MPCSEHPWLPTALPLQNAWKVMEPSASLPGVQEEQPRPWLARWDIVTQLGQGGTPREGQEFLGAQWGQQLHQCSANCPCPSAFCSKYQKFILVS